MRSDRNMFELRFVQSPRRFSMKLAFKILAVLAVTVFVAVPTFAQGSMHGKVVDREGKPVVGATIAIEHLSTHQRDDVKTNRNGEYSISGLFNGQYKVIVVQEGRAVMARGETTG